jgi:hypothetical protein
VFYREEDLIAASDKWRGRQVGSEEPRSFAKLMVLAGLPVGFFSFKPKSRCHNNINEKTEKTQPADQETPKLKSRQVVYGLRRKNAIIHLVIPLAVALVLVLAGELSIWWLGKLPGAALMLFSMAVAGLFLWRCLDRWYR